MDKIISIILLLFIFGRGHKYGPGDIKFLNTGLYIHYVSSQICCHNVNKHKLFIIILAYYGIAYGVHWHAYYTKIALILEYLKSS
jgi:hypothetical protein